MKFEIVGFDEELNSDKFNTIMLMCTGFKKSLNIKKSVCFNLEAKPCHFNINILGTCGYSELQDKYTITLYDVYERPFREMIRTIIHELAHVTYMNHSDEFTRLFKFYLKELGYEDIIPLGREE